MKDPRLVRMIVRKFAVGEDLEEDLFQEGSLAFLKAEQTYNRDAGVKFETYAAAVIRNRLIDVLRKKPASEHDGSDAADITGAKTLEDEVDLIEKNRLLGAVLSGCTDTERAIFNAYFQGFSYDEIGGIFGVNSKKIDNTIQKIKKRIKLKSGD